MNSARNSVPRFDEYLVKNAVGNARWRRRGFVTGRILTTP
jgi:hypothetical protein